MSETSSFPSVEAVITLLRSASYVADRSLATTVFLAERLDKPILVEGPAGVGKTELAKAIATVMNAELVRLQCYEGLDEAKTIYEWEYPKQLLYTQILREKIGDLLAKTETLGQAIDKISTQDNAFFSERFLLRRPLLKAISSRTRVVLLIDEIDRAEAELEAFFLEVLAEYQVTVPELGTIKAEKRPFVILTSNNTRELSDALRRRCLYLSLDYPSSERETEIVRLRVPEIEHTLASEVVRVVQALRTLDLRKKPSISETLDWARALVVLNVQALDPALVRETLNLVLKYEGDIVLAEPGLEKILPGRKVT